VLILFLQIGIHYFTDNGWGDLETPGKDVENVEGLLKQSGFKYLPLRETC
jgi:hypothetical protein